MSPLRLSLVTRKVEGPVIVEGLPLNYEKMSSRRRRLDNRPVREGLTDEYLPAMP